MEVLIDAVDPLGRHDLGAIDEGVGATSNGGVFHVQWDLYRVLGVGRRAAEPQIKAAFHNLAKAYHPDTRPHDRAAEEQFKEISAAYDVLKRKESRALYDRYRSRRRRQDFVIMGFLATALPMFFGGFVATALWLKAQQNTGATVAAVTERDERTPPSRALSAPQTELRNAPEHPVQPSRASSEAVQERRNEGPAALSTRSQASPDAGPRTETTRHAVLQAATLPEMQGAEESRKHEESASFTGQQAIGKPAPTAGNGKTRKTLAPPSTSSTHAASWQYTTDRPSLATRVPSAATSERFFDPAGTSR